jgi:hypothetical protein
MPKFGEPGWLLGYRENYPLTHIQNMHWSPPAVASAVAKQGGHIVVPFDLQIFTRMLAEIAHSFTCGELGHENFRPFLSDIILGKEVEKIGLFVGQSWIFPAREDNPSFHLMSLRVFDQMQAGNSVVVAGIQLFCADSRQRYTVVVGEPASTSTLPTAWRERFDAAAIP